MHEKPRSGCEAALGNMQSDERHTKNVGRREGEKGALQSGSVGSVGMY